MKIVKGKLYRLTIDSYQFPVVTSDKERALYFYKLVFPDQTITEENIECVSTIFSRDTLKEVFKRVKENWAEMCLLQASPGTIKFNKQALDLLLETTEIILTNK